MTMDNRYSDGSQFLKDDTVKIQNRLDEINHDLNEGKKEIENMHEYYWENYTEMDQYGYEEYDNRQALLQQTNANAEKLKLKHRFERMKDAPFFGRVDFIFEGEEEPEPFYIGIGNFAEKAGMIPLIYDWRAPVSGLSMIMIRGRHPMRLRQEGSQVRSVPNGSIRSAEERWSMPLRVIPRSMMRF